MIIILQDLNKTLAHVMWHVMLSHLLLHNCYCCDNKSNWLCVCMCMCVYAVCNCTCIFLLCVRDCVCSNTWDLCHTGRTRRWQNLIDLWHMYLKLQISLLIIFCQEILSKTPGLLISTKHHMSLIISLVCHHSIWCCLCRNNTFRC